MVLNSFILPAAYSVLALLLTWITNALFLPEEEEKRWWNFLIVLTQFLFLTLFFFIAMHKILLAMAVLSIIFLMVFSKPNVT